MKVYIKSSRYVYEGSIADMYGNIIIRDIVLYTYATSEARARNNILSQAKAKRNLKQSAKLKLQKKQRCNSLLLLFSNCSSLQMNSFYIDHFQLKEVFPMQK